MPESSKDFMILIISFISSFEINKVNLFPEKKSSFSTYFFSKLFIAFEAKLLNNPGELSLAKVIAFASAFLPKLANQEPKDSPYWFISGIWALLSFISVEILLAMAFLILVVCLVVRNNSCDNSSSWKFFLFILNIVPV